MSSIMTNAASMAALQTLRSINDQMDTTQNRISSGYRVETASDNAAYWSIATTMRSDNAAMSTVSDALGLGSAQVDVAYTAMESVKDTLDEIKTKLVAAQQPDVDKSKIQAEIEQLQADLKTFAESATFSGGNWLDVSETGTQNIVASFTRGADGSVSLGTIAIDTAKTALFNKNGAGLLQQASGNTATGGIANSDSSSVVSVEGGVDPGLAAVLDTGDVTLGTVAAGDTISFDLTVGDETVTITTAALAAGDDAAAIATALNTAIGSTALTGKVTVAANAGTNGFTFTTTATGADATVEVANFSKTGTTTAAYAGGTDTGEATGGTAGPASATMTGAFSAITLDDDDKISFTIDIDGETYDIAIDKATAETSALGGATISTKAEMVQVLTKAFENANLTVDTDGSVAGDIAIGVDASGQIKFTSETSDVNSKIELSKVVANSGSADFNVLDMDITDATSDELSTYLQGIDSMLSSVTSAAADLGAIKTRVGSQQDFVSKLMDAVDRGIGQLVDADMNEESTRLKALQTQQQLGIQALSIANSNSQNILSLFRG